MTERCTRGADVIVDALIRSGVTTVFGVPGDTGVVLYDAFYHRSGEIEHVLARDERHAAYMADAYARVTNRVGVVEVSSGGGATYAVGGLGDAFASGVPVLVISSDIHAASRGSGALTEIDQRGLFSAVTKAQLVVERADELPAAIEEALTTAITGRPAPVVLIVPENVLDEHTSATARTSVIAAPARREHADEAAVEIAARALAGARHPVLVAGGGVHISGAYQELRELAEALGAGIATTIHGVGAVGTGDPWRLGIVGNNSGQPGTNAHIAAADVVLLVGTRANATDTNSWTAPARYGQTVIQIDIDKARAGRNFPGSLPLVGDCRTVLAQLRRAVTPLEPGQRARRLEAVASARANATPSTASAEYAPGLLYPRAVVETVRGLLGEGTTVVADPGTPTPNVAAFWTQPRPGRGVVIPRGHGPMGYAIPAAIGIAKARPGRPVVAVTADGSFAMACGELETAARFALPILFVQLTNHSMGWIKMLQHLYTGGRYFGVDPGPTDAVMVAAANGIDGAAVTSIEELEKLAGEFAANPRPCYADVVVPHLIEYTPPVPAWDAGLAGHGERPVY
ncbi:thiamine pyrophosphate-binding protein [Saccharopolyspora sp. ASAGF58]|uniref:thiamine pyrophosphate-binding protein n=1 Tax=Saccharopolyspora sp. ASAGF58 TaxID=2719023 RepID=UPI00143FE463|nr:thiamine pyrophosphate-binding protein [Saccharopolyspora sp. ASAGF58]QIZ38784.1 thiamine pyrophosphate-binding protein [Saccharopolyspora sp. ASAGF58]